MRKKADPAPEKSKDEPKAEPEAEKKKVEAEPKAKSEAPTETHLPHTKLPPQTGKVIYLPLYGHCVVDKKQPKKLRDEGKLKSAMECQEKCDKLKECTAVGINLSNFQCTLFNDKHDKYLGDEKEGFECAVKPEIPSNSTTEIEAIKHKDEPITELKTHAQ